MPSILSDFRLRGRLSRAAFWLRHLLVLPVALWLVTSFTDGVVGAALAVALTWWLVCVWGQRLHDRALSSKWLLVVAIPVLGAAWLWWQCGLRGTSAAADSTYPTAPAPDYLAIQP